MRATSQYVAPTADGTYRISPPLCYRHVQAAACDLEDQGLEVHIYTIKDPTFDGECVECAEECCEPKPVDP